MDRVLLLARVDQVQRYLLTSPRLRQIRGGSHLLVRLEGELRGVVRAFGGEVGCASGGLLLAVFDDAGAAGQALDRVRGTIAGTVPAAGSRAVTSPWQAGEKLPKALERALAALESGSQPAGEPLGFGATADLPFALPCDVCGRRSARGGLAHAGRLLRACEDCTARHYGSATPGTHLARVQERLSDLNLAVADEHQPPGEGEAGLPPASRAATITDLGAASRPRNYVGYLAADGNAVGERLHQLTRFNEYRDFSEGLAEATVGAVIAAAERVANVGRGKLLPVLAGGDDLLLLCSPVLAVPMAARFAEALEQRTRSLPGGSLTTGVGVLIAHASTPFGAFDEAAHQLQKRAKALSRRSDGASAIAFHLLHESGEAGPERLEPAGGPDRPRQLGAGAYLLGDCDKLLGQAVSLRDSGAPWSRLRQLDTLLRRDEPGAEDDLELLLGAPSMAPALPALREAMELPSGSGAGPWAPWRDRGDGGPFVTALPDLLTLLEVL